MTDPTSRAAAADPATPQARLAELAYESAELRLLVAANPSAYPALLDWMRALDEPGLAGVLAARGGAVASVRPVASGVPITRLAADRTVIVIAAAAAVVLLVAVLIVSTVVVQAAEDRYDTVYSETY